VKIEKLRKEVFKPFKSLNLAVTETDFLDLYLDLKNNSYKPHRTENNTIQYINVDSNHPKKNSFLR